MHILMVNTYYPPIVYGGAELSVCELAEYLANEFKVTVISSSGTGGYSKELKNGVVVYRLPTRNLGTWQKAPRGMVRKAAFHLLENYNPIMDGHVKSLVNLIHPDVVHTHNLSAIGTKVWVYAKKRGAHVLHTIRDRKLLCPSHMFGRGLCDRRCRECSLYNMRRDRHGKSVDCVVGISHDILKSHLNEGLFPNARSRVIYNGTPDCKSAVVKAGSTRVFGFLGGLSLAKGIRFLLDVWKRSNLSYPLLVGGGAEDSVIVELGQKYGTDAVKILGRVDPIEFLSRIDILIVPSIFREPFGRVVTEAFSAGKPVIASRRGSFVELVEDGVNGWLFDPEDPADLLRCIGSANSIESAEVIAIGNRNREKYLANFGTERVMADYLSLYEELK